MPQPASPTVWTQLPSDEIRLRLDSVGLVLPESDRILICKHCKYALQPSGQTVSKHLWEKHSLPASSELIGSVHSVNLVQLVRFGSFWFSLWR